jgi:hypothetical protein
MGNNNCPLCNMEHKTKWYYEDDVWLICDCDSCNMPMIVYRKHLAYEEVEVADLHYIINKCMGLFGHIRFRTEHRKIPDHFHWHIIVDNPEELINYDDVVDDKINRSKR